MKNIINKIKVSIAKFLATFVPNAVFEQLKERDKFEGDFSQVYYSQEGEEIILRRFFKFSNTGFFVDVGAHHPSRFSNTYKLYILGWRGINIDATPGSMDLFKKQRPNDINIEAAISDAEETLTFYQFNETALNTFDGKKMLDIISNSPYKLISETKVKTYPLKKILDNYIPLNSKIDFFSIDAEGFDLKILKSNNWDKYKPKVILIETASDNLVDIVLDDITIYLGQHGYKPFAKTVKTVFYSL